MKNLEEATERICELKGSVVALDALLSALLPAVMRGEAAAVRAVFEQSVEAARTSMLNAAISESTIAAFEHDAARAARLLAAVARGSASAHPRGGAAVEPLLLAAPRLVTFLGQRALTGASGFFFRRDGRLYLVTSRHVLIDEPTGHLPDRIEVELHGDERDLSKSITLSLLLYRDGRAAWHQARDSGGEIDVAAIEIDARVLQGVVPRAFGPGHLVSELAEVEVGAPLLVVGFPLGFHDALHHLPVARQAAVASSFGTRFQGQGLFLTDARTHRGTSGAPVVMRSNDAALAEGGLPWRLLGIHSSRMDMGGRDRVADESLGLNCAWYADILLTLTAEPAAAVTAV